MLLALLHRRGRDDAAEGQAVHAPDDGVDGRGHRGGARLAVQQGELAKGAARSDLGHLAPALDGDVKLARVHDVKEVALVALRNDRLARLHRDLLHRVDDFFDHAAPPSPTISAAAAQP